MQQTIILIQYEKDYEYLRMTLASLNKIYLNDRVYRVHSSSSFYM